MDMNWSSTGNSWSRADPDHARGGSSSSSLSLPSPFSSSPPSSSKYKGVRKRKWGKWVSEIRLPNSRERIWLGSYNSAEKAARAFDAALFCLRGRNAKFNFPDSPPDIVAAHNLTHQEIQAVASRYANEYSGPEGGTANDDQALGTNSTDDPAASQGGREHSIDWSFLGALDQSEGPGFGFLYSDMDYMTGDIQLHLPPAPMGSNAMEDEDHFHDNDGASGGSGGNYSHQSSFLWNF